MRVDSVTLAAEAFDACRHGLEMAGTLLPALLAAMDAAENGDTLWPELKDDKLAGLEPDTRRAIEASPGEAPACPVGDPLWKFCRTGALELLCLWREGRGAAVRSLGYALHPVPAALRDGEALDPERYELCFAVAAFCWDEYARPLHEELARRMGLPLKDAVALARQEGFAVDMFGAPVAEAETVQEEEKPAKPWWRFW